MKTKSEWETAAACMFPNGKIPNNVSARLQHVSKLCLKAGGVLRSRQVIASIIAQLQFEEQGFNDHVHTACIGGSSPINTKKREVSYNYPGRIR